MEVEYSERNLNFLSFFFFFFLSIILYAFCTGYTVVQSTKQVCTQIREIKEYNINNIIILMP